MGDLDFDRYVPSVPASTEKGRPPGLQTILRDLPVHGGGLVTRDGSLIVRHIDAELENEGVRVAPLSELEDGEELLASVADPVDVFGEMNAAFGADPLVVDVPDGVVLEAPIVNINWIQADGLATLPRLVVRIGRDAEASVLQIEGSADVAALTVPVVDIRVDPTGRCGFLSVQALGRRVQRLASHASTVDQRASFVSAQAAIGGGYARTRTDCRLVGRGASGDLLALYFGEDDQMLDFRTFQMHQARDTSSNLMFKGALGGASRSVYTGLIRVEPEGAGSDAFQTNRNIKLSDDAWAESVPNLEIENNDVRCSHASTVSPVDADQLFYLESRGVPSEVASRLVVAGFFDEVLSQLPVGDMEHRLRKPLLARIERSLA